MFKTLRLNLFDNSIKAECTDLWITGKYGDKGAYPIRIADNERGIPSAELNRITEAFYRVDKSRSRQQHSLGLGLALGVKIAEIHGSTLTFHSNGTNSTVVEFDLLTQGGEIHA